MKILFSSSIILIVVLTGCSTKFTVRDFPSKEKFYEDFNTMADNKPVNITLLNDSTFRINDGVVLKNDTLFCLRPSETTLSRTIAKSDIKEISYTNNDYKSAIYMLKSGEKLDVNNIVIASDSMKVDVSNSLLTNYYLTSIDRVKTVTYIDSFKRMPIGILSGGIIGFLIGEVVVNDKNHEPNPNKSNDYYLWLLAGPIGGMIAGIIISTIIGYDNIYQFNN
jgi:hypothetical protein